MYELHPFSEDRFMQGTGPDYSEPYRRENVVDEYPLFIKRAEEKGEKLDPFQTFDVDPQRWPP